MSATDGPRASDADLAALRHHASLWADKPWAAGLGRVLDELERLRALEAAVRDKVVVRAIEFWKLDRESMSHRRRCEGLDESADHLDEQAKVCSRLLLLIGRAAREAER
jgi:hypothetical protein